MFVQNHEKLFDATGWPRLNTIFNDVGLSLLKISSNIDHATFSQQCCTMVASFEQPRFRKGRTYGRLEKPQ